MSIEISDRTTRFARIYTDLGESNTSEAFSKFAIGIVGNSGLLKTHNGQVMAIAIANLLPRFHPHLKIILPEGIERRVWVPFGYDGDLRTCMSNIITMIGSQVDLDDSSDMDILISIGKTLHHAHHKISINSDGWNAYFSVDDECIDFMSRNDNAIGALTAASFAAAEAFRRLLELLGSKDRRIQLRRRTFSFSALDYSVNDCTAPNLSLPEMIDIQDVTVVGAGAVANGLIFALGCMPNIKGVIRIVDPQSYDITNLNRCLLANISHVGLHKAKAILNIRFEHLQIIPFVGRYETFRQKRKKLELVISTIDENDPRIIIQSDLPKLLLHGATGENVATISRHNFIDCACLGCLFSEYEPLTTRISRETGITIEEVEKLLAEEIVVSQEQILRIALKTGIPYEKIACYIGKPFVKLYNREICGVVTVDLSQQQVAATAPFVSALPGILLTSEIIKEKIQELAPFRLNNYLSISLFSPSARWLQKRPKEERCRCLCSDPIMIELYQKKWQNDE